MLSTALRTRRNASLGGFMGSALQFFTPTESFFQALAEYKDKRIVDAGAGMGLVSIEAAARGFDMVAVDIMPREGQWERVLIMEAESMPYDANMWLLLCRPDHSGWAYDTLEHALQQGAGVFYAGLARNFDIDLGGYVGRESMRWENVGKEGETLFLFLPDALLAASDFD
ncbi:MAG: hypothetical protein Q7S87_01540 [Agitococcus sp.]|nr:hypothetical protein [Agitococcus sp.]MDO9179569.1 hypothetical protein [Agitococcus sp.]